MGKKIKLGLKDFKIPSTQSLLLLLFLNCFLFPYRDFNNEIFFTEKKIQDKCNHI